VTEVQNTTGRRVNLKFIIAGCVALALIGLAAVVLMQVNSYRRDQEVVAWGDKAMAEGRFEDAATDYGRAVERHPNDAELALKDGDALYQLSASKPERLRQVWAAWEAAVHARPDFMPALDRLMNFATDLVEVRPTASSFHDLGEAADALARVAPADGRAITAGKVAALESWFAHSPATSQPATQEADSRAHEQMVAALGARLDQVPADPEALLYYSRAASRRAVEIRQHGTLAAAYKELDRADQRLNNAVARAPQMPAEALFRAAQGYLDLAEAHLRVQQMPDPPSTRPVNWKPAATRATTRPRSQPATVPARPPHDLLGISSSASAGAQPSSAFTGPHDFMGVPLTTRPVEGQGMRDFLGVPLTTRPASSQPAATQAAGTQPFVQAYTGPRDFLGTPLSTTAQPAVQPMRSTYTGSSDLLGVPVSTQPAVVTKAAATPRESDHGAAKAQAGTRLDGAMADRMRTGNEAVVPSGAPSMVDRLPIMDRPSSAIEPSQASSAPTTQTVARPTAPDESSPERAVDQLESSAPAWQPLGAEARSATADQTDSESAGVAVATTRPTGAALRYLDAARALIARARQAAAATDRHVLDMALLEAHIDGVTGDSAAAEKILRQLLSQRPKGLRVLVPLAGLLSGSHPQEAIALLEQEDNPTDAGPGPAALRRRDLLVQATLGKGSLYLNFAETSDDPQQRSPAMIKAAAACDSLAAMLVENPQSLKLTARLRMLQARYADAVRAVDRALAIHSAARTFDPELPPLRAKALIAMHEPDAALATLSAALEVNPHRSDDRLMMARVLIDLGRPLEAADQIGFLEKSLPDDPRLTELKIRVLAVLNSPEPDTALIQQIEALFQKLGQETPKQQVHKAELAMSIDHAADAVILLQAAQAANPSSAAIAAQLSTVLSAAGKAGQANAVLVNAISQHPADADLISVQKSLSGPLSLEQYEKELSGKGQGEFVSLIAAADAALADDKLSDAMKKLEAAGAMKNNDPLLYDATFRYLLASGHWNEAGDMLNKLIAANFDHMGGLWYEFQLDAAHGYPIAAVVKARVMTQRFGGRALAWTCLGDALAALAHYDRAIEAYNRAMALENDDLAAVKGLARCNVAVGRHDEADTWIARGRVFWPADSDFREMELNRQLSEGDPRRLIAAREAAIAAEPQRWDNVVALGRIYLRINTLESVTDAKAAKDAALKAVEILNGAMKKWPDERACAFWAAHASSSSGDAAAGLQVLQLLAQRDAWAKRPQAWQMLADYAQNYGDPRSHEMALRNVMSHGGANVTTAMALAKTMAAQGVVSGALDVLNTYPNDPRVMLERMDALVAGGLFSHLEQQLKSAHEITPHSTRVMTLLGMLYFVPRDAAQRNDKSAAEWLDRAITAGAQGLARRIRGAILLRHAKGSAAQAIADLTLAWEADLSDPTTALLLSEAHRRNHDPASAQRVLQTALRLSPRDKPLRLSLILSHYHDATRNWNVIHQLIDEGRLLAPSDPDWDATEARMCFDQGDTASAAALMRHAMQLATARSHDVGTAIGQQNGLAIRALLRDELTMLRVAHADQAALDEAQDVINRYGANDSLTALAHLTRGQVQRRLKIEDQGAAEFDAALATAEATKDLGTAAATLDDIAADGGVDAALDRIRYHGSYAAMAPSGQTLSPLAADPAWDLVRIELLSRAGRTTQAVAEGDRLMLRLDSLAADKQVQLLHLVVQVQLAARPMPNPEKATAACLELLKRNPNDLLSLNNLANLYLDFVDPPQPQQALRYARSAFELIHKSGQYDPRIADTYGWALTSAGQSAQAVEVLTQAASVFQIPDVEYHLAAALLMTSAPSAAWPHLENAVRFADRDERAGRPLDPKLRQRITDGMLQSAGEIW
jgi:tetratricopeptide (TPR) repeat protein